MLNILAEHCSVFVYICHNEVGLLKSNYLEPQTSWTASLSIGRDTFNAFNQGTFWIQRNSDKLPTWYRHFLSIVNVPMEFQGLLSLKSIYKVQNYSQRGRSVSVLHHCCDIFMTWCGRSHKSLVHLYGQRLHLGSMAEVQWLSPGIRVSGPPSYSVRDNRVQFVMHDMV